MKASFEHHCHDDSLEMYALGRLDEALVALLEEHILFCESCRVRLDDADRYAPSMRQGALRLRLESEARAARLKSWRWFGVPAQGWAAAAVVVCVVAIGSTQLNRRDAAGSLVPVPLTAERGIASSAPAHHPLLFKMDLRGLDNVRSLKAELVNADGAVLETGIVSMHSETADFQSRRNLPTGAYFLRLYSLNDTESLREFALRIE